MSPWASPKSVMTRFNRKKNIWMSWAFANASTMIPGRLVIATPEITCSKPKHTDLRQLALISIKLMCVRLEVNIYAYGLVSYFWLCDWIIATHRTAHVGCSLHCSLYTCGLNAECEGSCHMGHKLHRDAHCLQIKVLHEGKTSSNTFEKDKNNSQKSSRIGKQQSILI